jgi:phage terminase small subunit
MNHRGRKSMASLSVVSPVEPVERLRPPAFLAPEEAEVFADIIAATSAKHFRPSDLPLLTAYAQAIATQRIAAAEFKKQPLVSAAVEERAAKTMVMLSLRLRLSPQARDKRAPPAQRKLSYLERSALARTPDADDDEDEE